MNNKKKIEQTPKRAKMINEKFHGYGLYFVLQLFSLCSRFTHHTKGYSFMFGCL